MKIFILYIKANFLNKKWLHVSFSIHTIRKLYFGLNGSLTTL